MWVKNNWLSNSSSGDNGIYVGKTSVCFSRTDGVLHGHLPFPPAA